MVKKRTDKERISLLVAPTTKRQLERLAKRERRALTAYIRQELEMLVIRKLAAKKP
jgi:mRNA-degrading endonuclease RelE of RelBE toxin-antitoxin system